MFRTALDYTNQTGLQISQVHSGSVTAIDQIKGSNFCVSTSSSGEVKLWICLQPGRVLASYNKTVPISDVIHLEGTSKILTLQSDYTMTMFAINLELPAPDLITPFKNVSVAQQNISSIRHINGSQVALGSTSGHILSKKAKEN